MVNFFKTIGKGLFYIVLFPTLLVLIGGYAIFGIFIFLFMFGKMIYLFFTGRSLASDLEEDIKVKALIAKERGDEEKEEEESELSLYPSDSPLYSNTFASEFEQKEEKTEEEEKEDE